jgi:hypothetical protein
VWFYQRQRLVCLSLHRLALLKLVKVILRLALGLLPLVSLLLELKTLPTLLLSMVV